MTESMPSRSSASRLARWSLAAFVLTFLLARILVLLIMSRRAPDLFLYVGQTHVHHLNYGIFLLVAIAGWLLFIPPRGRKLDVAAMIYGVGLALTFDEFGMWLHLGGSYWQRASYDAVIIAAALLGLIAFAPALRRMRPRHWIFVAIIFMALAIFTTLMIERLQRLGPTLHRIEQSGPQ